MKKILLPGRECPGAVSRTHFTIQPKGLNYEDHSPKNVVFGSFTALFAPRQTLVWRWKSFHTNYEMTSIPKEAFMLTGILWNGSGVVCLAVAWQLLRRTIALLRKENRSTVACTICLGIVVGVAGIVCGVLMLLPVSNFITGFTMSSDMYFIISLIAGLFFFYFGVFAVGTVASGLLRKVCHEDAVVEIALILASLVLAQPVVYGWFKSILKTI